MSLSSPPHSKRVDWEGVTTFDPHRQILHTASQETVAADIRTAAPRPVMLDGLL